MAKKSSTFVLWITDAGARNFLGLERPNEHISRWAIIGDLAPLEELNALGVWINIERMEERSRGTDAEVIKGWVVTPKLCLIRYEFIIHAQHLGKDSGTSIGFKAN